MKTAFFFAYFLFSIFIPMKGMIRGRASRGALLSWDHCMRLALLLLAALAACFPGLSSAGDGIIVYSHPANVGQLNPHMYSPNQMYAQEMVYEPLVMLGDDGLIHPCLAERWDISGDGLVYTFSLRQGVRFSDGEAFDAHAAVKNFEHIFANRSRHAWLELANTVDSFEAVDEHTLRITLKAPYYPALQDLSLPRPFRFLSPAAFPETGITRDGIKKPVGTGPWKLAETRLGEYDRFEPNDLYWAEPPKPAGMLVKVIPDPISRAMALQTGEIDLILGQGQISFDTFAALEANPAFTTRISKPVGTVAVAINSARFPTDDLAVRQALQHFVDKDALIAGVFLGAQPRADTLFPPDVPYCDVGLEPYTFDPAHAASILDEAGWTAPSGGVRRKDGRELAIDFCFVGNDAAQKAVAEVLQGQAARLGVRLNLVGEEEDSFYRRQKEGNFGMIVNTTWGPPFEPHAMLGSMQSPSHADYQAQRGLPMKADIDRDITLALRSVDPVERAALYKTVLTVLHEQAVYLPIHYAALLAAYPADRLEGVRFGPGKSKFPFEVFMKKD